MLDNVPDYCNERKAVMQANDSSVTMLEGFVCIICIKVTNICSIFYLVSYYNTTKQKGVIFFDKLIPVMQPILKAFPFDDTSLIKLNVKSNPTHWLYNE